MTDKSKFSIIGSSTKITKPWGYEIIFSPEDSGVTSKLLHIDAGKRFSFQYHDQKEENLTLIEGKCKLHLEDKEGQIKVFEMEEKKGYFIRPFQKHRCEAIIDCDILESSTKESGNTVRLEDDYQRGTETEEKRKGRLNKKVYLG